MYTKTEQLQAKLRTLRKRRDSLTDQHYHLFLELREVEEFAVSNESKINQTLIELEELQDG